jgi:hypothetical protein
MLQEKSESILLSDYFVHDITFQSEKISSIDKEYCV